MTQEIKSHVVIVGRPNVGKSTLFNRLVGKKIALVHDMPGMTRDRRQAEASLYDLTFTLTDTAGLEDLKTSVLSDSMRQQTLVAMEEADLILFVVDGREGCTPYDRDLAQLMRQQKTPVVILANKCEGYRGATGVAEASSLGLGEVVSVSAEHGEGLYELYEAIQPTITKIEESDDLGQKPLHLAIVGRPNVGKSTLINRLIGKERLLTGDMPGVTRDAISLSWIYKEKAIKITDTAGMRRQAKVETSSERLAVMDTKRSIQYAEVVVMVLDATMPFEKQDLSIASHVIEEGRALVLALNKWDAISDKNQLLKKVEDALETQLSQVKGIPCIPISATEGKNLNRLMDSVLAVYTDWNRRLSTGQLNRWLEFATSKHPPPAVNGRRIRLKYMTQIKSRPPTFAVFSSKSNELPDSYSRYLINTLREDFKMWGVPIRMHIREGDNPYAPKKKR